MTKQNRIFPDECILHILTRGNNKERVFYDNQDFTKYLDLIRKYKKQQELTLYHYCIMSNHVHLIVKKNLSVDLSKFIKQLNLSYAHYYGKKYKHSGHLWQGRYKSIVIDSEKYLIICGKYIELNPVRAKIVKNPSEYIWSSYNVYAYGKKSDIVDYEPLYYELGDDDVKRQKTYRERMLDGIDKINLECACLGPKDFVNKMEREYGIKNLRKASGRPKKSIIK